MKAICKTAAALAVAVFLQAAPAIGTGIPVIDTSALVQHTQNVLHQVTQIQHMVTQIDHQRRAITGTPFSLSSDLMGQLNSMRNSLNSVNSIAFDPSVVTADFQRNYPTDYQNFADVRQLTVFINRQLDGLVGASTDSANIQAQAASTIPATAGRIQSALGASTGAQGQTQAVQAGNQMLGVIATQLSELKAQVAADAQLRANVEAQEASERRQFQQYLQSGPTIVGNEERY